MSEDTTTYRWSRLTPDDVAAWSTLVNHLAVVDGTEEFMSEEDLLEDLQTPHTDPALDSWAIWAGDQLVGYGHVYVPITPDNEGLGRTYLGGGVHADHRGRGVGRELMDRLEARAAELAGQRHPELSAYFGVSGGLEGSSARAMLKHRGYVEVRYFNLLTRPLGDQPEVADLEGVRLITPGDEHEEAVRVAHNDAFRDHWGSGESSPESWHSGWTARSKRMDVSTIAVDEDGAVLAYVLCGEWVDRELYVNIVGTISRARGRGLAMACLNRTIALASASGRYDVIELDVDSDSPTGATRLYERVGFTHKHQTAAMRKPLSAPVSSTS